MQKKIKLLLVCVVMLVQLSGFVCDLHSDSSHSEDSAGMHLDSVPESHHDDCITQPQMVALLSIGSGMKVNLVLQPDAFIASPAYLGMEAAHAALPTNWLPGRAVPFPPRSMSPILRI